MKYMGSKRWMLSNGLGDLLNRTAKNSTRFVDLFSGSSSVVAFVASRHAIPVLSVDLQNYSKVLSASIIHRTKPLTAEQSLNRWIARAQKTVSHVRGIPSIGHVTRQSVREARDWCEARRGRVITKAYGGHYFSPAQAIWLDALRTTAPRQGKYRSIALATLVDVAAYCAAAPGHTAQPFQPTRSARRFLRESWERDVIERTSIVFKSLCAKHAQVRGRAIAGDALNVAKKLREGDLVFIDPPYSGVHYSRFYHVLETVATGRCGEVSGIGRYPSSKLRPKSAFSISSTSQKTIEQLFRRVAKRKARAIVTFPSHECSNGMSGSSVRKAAQKYFRVRSKTVSSRFSTLGGNADASGIGGRTARISAKELILLLEPRRDLFPKAI
jgi:adenine-specific DNA-methyltransferase